jgi:drug/metabolite transporter (DMT)-like permease
MKVTTKFKAVLSAAVGATSALFGALGILGCLCTYPILAAIFATLGISSLILAEYHTLFLLTGIIFISLSIFYLIKLLKKNKCRIGGRK